MNEIYYIIYFAYFNVSVINAAHKGFGSKDRDALIILILFRRDIDVRK